MSFLKFGNEHDIFDLYNNGTIYMNPLYKFTEMEDNELRGDKYEGVTEIRNYPAGQFIIPSIERPFKYQSFHLTETSKYNLGNIYSLYAISSYGFPIPKDFHIDDRVKRFGSHFLMIKNLPVFFQLMKQKLLLAGYVAYHDFVDYYDKRIINGKISVFQKPIEFEYQKEFRFYVNNKLSQPLIIKIGSLKKISEIHCTDEIKGLRLQSKKTYHL